MKRFIVFGSSHYPRSSSTGVEGQVVVDAPTREAAKTVAENISGADPRKPLFKAFSAIEVEALERLVKSSKDQRLDSDHTYKRSR